MKPIKDYYIDKKIHGWKYETKAEDINEAVEHFHYHLRSYKYTKDQIRDLVKEGVLND